MFTLVVSYEGFDPELDKRIAKSIGCNSWDSGMGFGRRELFFDFDSKKEAESAEGKVFKRFPKNVDAVVSD